MTYTVEQIIVTRLLSAVEGLKRIALGEGIPQLLRPHLQDSCELISLNEVGTGLRSFDAVVAEARQVSEKGDVCLFPGDKRSFDNIIARRWIVATPHFDERGDGKLLDHLTLEIDCRSCADLIITELGVIEVSELGFELREVAPGRSSDDVRSAVQASLHVADDLDLMQLGS